MKQTSNRKFHYAFLVVIVYAIALPAVFLFSNAFGLYMVPITEELGISHGAYSLTQSFNEIVSGVLYFLYVRIERRFKIRYIITAGAFAGALAALLYAVSGNLPMIFLASAVSGFIWPLFSQVSVGNIVNNWFARKGATIISAMFTFSNLCAFFTSKMVASWIESSGWRTAMLYTMWLILAVTVLVFLVIRDHPSAKNLTPWGVEHKEGETEAKPDPATLPGARFKTSLRSPKLYCAYLWTFITGLIVYPVVYAVPAHLSKVGFDTVFSGDVVGLFSIGSVVFLLPLGWAMDRWGVRVGTTLCVGGYLLAIASLLVITPERSFLGPVIGLAMGVGIILFTVLPVFMRDVFGFKEYSKFMSYSVVFRTIGSTLGFPLLNFTYDKVGSYNTVFAIFGGLSVILLILGVVATSKKHPLWVETRPGFQGYVEPAKAS
ncbi:MFS transporter [Oscillospiraceae bacterium]|uniref:MFS transporter n=1 Tax=Allofournierella sp. TaxID=1940256 RepID=UPI0015A98223|nr:MFS transporter [Oscillospiraceae bacterium]